MQSVHSTPFHLCISHLYIVIELTYNTEPLCYFIYVFIYFNNFGGKQFGLKVVSPVV